MIGSSPRVRGKPRGHFEHLPLARLIPARAGKTPTTPRPPCTGPAHPRACGENPRMRGASRAAASSSPRVRGKLRVVSAPGDHCGLIPARAGKTSAECGWPCGRGAHPRACGENQGTSYKEKSMDGSSPRVRGKLLGHLYVTAEGGAHPRACGENPEDVPSLEPVSGSSPRVRGKLLGHLYVTAEGGLIPARAGKTVVLSRACLRGWAHPRACGENPPGPSPTVAAPGSSPRVRGKPTVTTGTVVWGRLIPARAGKTFMGLWATNDDMAHPRVRGKQEQFGIADAQFGLIPARAGKTRWAAPRPRRTAAHPRACGENVDRGVEVVQCWGSSPRVRGKRGRAHHQQRRGRLIPARAGKTWRGGAVVPWGAAHPRACGENIQVA